MKVIIKNELFELKNEIETEKKNFIDNLGMNFIMVMMFGLPAVFFLLLFFPVWIPVSLYVGLLAGMLLAGLIAYRIYERKLKDLHEGDILFQQCYLKEIAPARKYIRFTFLEDEYAESEPLERILAVIPYEYSPELDRDTIIVDYKKKKIYISGLYMLSILNKKKKWRNRNEKRKAD